jgi:hypothetical protein
MKSIKERAQALLTLVEALVETPGLTWEAASNAVFAPKGPFWHLFRTQAARVAFDKTREGRRIEGLIFSLPAAPLRPAPKEEYDPTRIVEIIQLPAPPLRSNARKAANQRSTNNGAGPAHRARAAAKTLK